MKNRLFGMIALATTALTAPAFAEVPAGAYLAARQSFLDGQFEASAEYNKRVLASEPEALVVADSIVSAYAAVGDFESALPFARQLAEGNNISQIANMVVLVSDFTAGNRDDVYANLEQGVTVSVMVDSAMQAWGALEDGRANDALAAFDDMAEQEGLAAFASYQKALALAYVGDFEGADALLAAAGNAQVRVNVNALIAQAQVLSQLNKQADAIAMLEAADPMGSDPVIASILTRLRAGEAIPFDAITSPRDGLAEVFLTIAAIAADESVPSYTLAYAWAAHLLAPERSDAVLLTAGLLEDIGRHDLASQTYALVPQDDPAFLDAEIGRANVLESDGRIDEAIAVLTDLAAREDGSAYVVATLGDVLRRNENFAEARDAYSRALDIFGPDNTTNWFVYFARGITHERLKEWDAAEADFRKALELQPGHPSVLNYLGYSLVERREKLDEALAMIEQAVAAAPTSGAIIDSLGWALFQLGRYDEAVPQLERAAELEATDPVVTDHLGDGLWAVGRKTEATFQWKRALSFAPEEAEAERIRRKLDIGLDAVLAEEGADPLKASSGNN